MIVVLAGAGASTAVSPDDYPTTGAFVDRLPSSVTENLLFKLTVDRLASSESSGQVDIEVVLWSLGEVVRVTRAIADPRSETGFLFDGDRVNPLLRVQADFRGFVNHCKSLQNAAESLQAEINHVVYEVYKPLPSTTALDTNWARLLPMLLARDEHLELFTTNYDRVLETAIERNKLAVETGRRTDVDTYLDQSWWGTELGEYRERLKTVSAVGLLTKLHGSIDWTRDHDHVRWGNPAFGGADDRQIILYPGFKGEPVVQPFLSFHSHLERVLPSAVAIVVIGFAFRDEAITRTLRTYRQPDCPLIILNPAESLPALEQQGGFRRAVHIKLPFDKLGIEKVMMTVDQTLTNRIAS